MNKTAPRLLVGLATLLLLLMPWPSHAQGVDSDCTKVNPISALLIQQGFRTDGPYCQPGTALGALGAESGVLRAGESRSYELPADTGRILLQSKLIRGTLSAIQIEVTQGSDSQIYPFQDTINLLATADQPLAVRYLSAVPMEVTTTVSPVYAAWGPTYNLLTDQALVSSPPVEELRAPLFLIGRPAAAEQLGLAYELQPIERAEVVVEPASLVTIASVTNSPRLGASLVGDFDSVLVGYEGITLVAMSSFIAADGSLQRAIIMAPDIFRLDAKEVGVVLEAMRGSLSSGVSGLPVLPTLNPAEATWLNVGMTLLRNALLPILLFLLVLLVGVGGPLVRRTLSQKRGLETFILPANHLRYRLLQVSIFWGATLSALGLVTAQAILQAENSKALLRQLIDRLKGLEGNAAFCRKCVLLEETPWILSLLVLGLTASLAWLLWPGLHQMAEWGRSQSMLRTKKARPLAPVWTFGLLGGFVLTLGLALLWADQWLVWGLAAVLILSYWLLWPLTQPVSRLRGIWVIYGLLILLPLLQLYRGIQSYYLPFVGEVRAELSIRDALGMRSLTSDTVFTIDPTLPLSLEADSSTRVEPASSQLSFDILGAARLGLISKSAWETSTPIMLSTKLVDYSASTILGAKKLYYRTELAVQPTSVVDAIQALPLGAEVAVLTEMSEPWQSREKDYLDPRAFLANSVTTTNDSPTVHSVGLVGSAEVIGYTRLSAPGTITIGKRDLNQQLGDDVAVVSVISPEGNVVAAVTLEDDGEMLGRLGVLQEFELTIPEEGFTAGVYELNINSPETVGTADYQIERITLASSDLVFRGPLTVQATKTAYIRPVETTTILPALPIGAGRGSYCLVQDGRSTCSADWKMTYYLEPKSEPRQVRFTAANLQINDDLTLVSFAESAYFSPFDYLFRRSIGDETPLVVADARLTVTEVRTSTYQVVIDAKYTGNVGDPPWTFQLYDASMAGRYPQLSQLQFVWKK